MKKINLALLAAGFAPALVFAQDHAATVASTVAMSPAGSAYWAAGICMGLAAAVVGFAQSQAAIAALEGIGRNPAAQKALFIPLILSLALMESLVLFAFVIANGLAAK